MSARRSARKLVVAVLLGVLVGGGLMAVTPAGAEVSQAAATRWKKVWKKSLKPLAVKTFYTKEQSDAAYQPKGSYATAGSAYTKAETYSKAEVDAKLAPFANSVAAFASGDQDLPLETAAVVRSVSLVAPANGTVVVSSSAYIQAQAAGSAIARCSLTTGTTLDFAFLQYSNMPDAASSESEVISGTRAFAATKGNLVTVNLVCDEFAGTVAVGDSALTAIFAPS